MKTAILSLMLLFAPCLCLAETLTFEGKAGALVKRSAVCPWPMLVEKVLVTTGQNVEKGGRLLDYRLEPANRRALQMELLNGGDSLNAGFDVLSAEQEAHAVNIRSRTSGDMAARGLGSQRSASQDAQASALVRRKQSLLQRKKEIAASDFNLRLRELEASLGHRLKIGQQLPDMLFLPAPMAGTVVNIAPEVRPGSLVAAGAAAVTIALLNPIQVEIQVHEREITRLHDGQQVWVELANNQKTRLEGRISRISWQPADPAIAVPSFYFVHIDVDNPEHILKPGYKVLAHVEAP